MEWIAKPALRAGFTLDVNLLVQNSNQLLEDLKLLSNLLIA
jgi:hypothetical protein